MVPLVSVIIPTYQCGHLLVRAIDSALAQTYPSVEIIVVNDGSTDNTDEIILPYIDKIIYIKQQNKGAATARNIGIQQASGSYIAFLDADDYYLSKRLNSIMEVLMKSINCFATTDYYVEVEGHKAETPNFGSMDERFELNSQKQFEALLNENFIFSQVVMPRSILDEVGLFDESLRYSEDWDLWLRCTAAGYKALFIDEPLSVYTAGRPGSLTSQKTLRKAQDSLHILSKYSNNARALSSIKRVRGSISLHAMKKSFSDRKYSAMLINALHLVSNFTYLWKVIIRKLLKLSSKQFYSNRDRRLILSF